MRKALARKKGFCVASPYIQEVLRFPPSIQILPIFFWSLLNALQSIGFLLEPIWTSGSRDINLRKMPFYMENNKKKLVFEIILNVPMFGWMDGQFQEFSSNFQGRIG